jgi:multidrug efflux system membrane fusion protein
MDRRQAQPRSIRIEIPCQPPSDMLVERNRSLAANPWSESGALSWARPPQKQQNLVAIFVVLIVLLLCGAIFTVWHSVLKSHPVADVAVYRVSSQAIAETVGGSGVLYPAHEVVVQFPEATQVLSVNVKAGQTVKTGQTLLKLDPGQFLALMQQAQARLAAAQAYLQAITVHGTTAQIAAAQRQVDLAQSAHDRIQQQENSFLGGDVTSSINGVVTQVNVNAGEAVSANMPLLTVMDESTLIVHAVVPLTSANQVQVNQKASVTVWAASAITVTGTVIAIVPAADPQTATFEVWVAFPNASTRLLAGMSAFVMIQSIKTLQVVPRLAVIDRDSNPQVFVVGADGRAHLQSVQVCGRKADLLLVDRGLTNGQQVIVVGLDTLLDRQPVHIIYFDK